MIELQELYRLLDAEMGASEHDLKVAYVKATRRWHRDRAPEGQEDEYSARFEQVKKAYKILTHPETRAYYQMAGQRQADSLRQVDRDTQYQVCHMTPEEVVAHLAQHAIPESNREILQAQEEEEQALKASGKTTTDLLEERLRQRQQEALPEIPKLFDPDNYNQADFHRTFEYFKSQTPEANSRAVEPVPEVRGGLVSLDQAGVIDFREGGALDELGPAITVDRVIEGEHLPDCMVKPSQVEREMAVQLAQMRLEEESAFRIARDESIFRPDATPGTDPSFGELLQQDPSQAWSHLNSQFTLGDSTLFKRGY
jgi:curved DNA-binding protein CbpA